MRLELTHGAVVKLIQRCHCRANRKLEGLSSIIAARAKVCCRANIKLLSLSSIVAARLSAFREGSCLQQKLAQRWLHRGRASSRQGGCHKLQLPLTLQPGKGWSNSACSFEQLVERPMFYSSFDEKAKK